MTAAVRYRRRRLAADDPFAPLDFIFIGSGRSGPFGNLPLHDSLATDKVAVGPAVGNRCGGLRPPSDPVVAVDLRATVRIMRTRARRSRATSEGQPPA